MKAGGIGATGAAPTLSIKAFFTQLRAHIFSKSWITSHMIVATGYIVVVSTPDHRFGQISGAVFASVGTILIVASVVRAVYHMFLDYYASAPPEKRLCSDFENVLFGPAIGMTLCAAILAIQVFRLNFITWELTALLTELSLMIAMMACANLAGLLFTNLALCTAARKLGHTRVITGSTD